jgi:hypothetical protein
MREGVREQSDALDVEQLDYLSAFLLAMLNPACKSLRALAHASHGAKMRECSQNLHCGDLIRFP